MRTKGDVVLIGIVALATLLAAYFGVGGFISSNVTWPKDGTFQWTPDEDNITYENVTFPGQGVTLKGWWMPKPGSDKTAILIHGINSNRANLMQARMARMYLARGYNVLAFDLRGHGQSSPSRATYGLNEALDILSATQYVQTRGFPTQKIVWHAWSMGGGAALQAARFLETPLYGVISDSGFSDLSKLLDYLLPRLTGMDFIKPSVEIMSQSMYGFEIAQVKPILGVQKLRALGTPLAMIHGVYDTTVPYYQFEDMQKAYPEAKVWIIPNGEHIDAGGRPAYESKMFEFWDYFDAQNLKK